MSAKDEWASAVLPATLVPEVVGTALAAEVRARLESRGFARFALLDRGSYDVALGVDEPEILTALAGVASEIAGRTLRVVDTKAVRLTPGDYILVRHDRVHEGRPVELVLDLSASPVPGAEVHYRHRGQVFFAFPSQPGAMGLVERGPTVMCNHTYVSKRWKGSAVVRLVALLA